MGPFAATYFLNRLLQFTPAEKEWDYFRIFADYNVFIPSRTRALLYGETSPAPELIKTINGLERMGVDLVAVPCNSGHGWYGEVVSKIKVPWLNLIETTAEAVERRNVSSTLIISAYVPAKKKLYDRYLENTIYLKEKEQKKLYKLIELLKLDSHREPIKNELYKIIEPYKTKVDGIIIACTEPSMLFGMDEKEWEGFQVVDSTNEYAKRCVELCMGIKL